MILEYKDFKIVGGVNEIVEVIKSLDSSNAYNFKKKVLEDIKAKIKNKEELHKLPNVYNNEGMFYFDDYIIEK